MPARALSRLGLTLLVAVIATAFMLPVLWMLASAVRPPETIFRYLDPLDVRLILPASFSLESFSALIDTTFARAVLNSLVVAVATVVGGVLLCSVAAFGLSALEYRYRNALFAVVVISFMVPFEVVAIPLATVMRSWSLENTYAGLILPGLANGLAIFLLRQFFLGIPQELRDAARVDGAGWWAIFWRIYLPLSKPALIGAGLLLFMFQWREYLWPLLIVSDPSMDVAPVALAKFLGQFQFNFGELFAGAVIVAAIPALMLLRFQRYFRASGATTGLKG